METEELITSDSGSRHFQMQSEPLISSIFSVRSEPTRMFDELPNAIIIDVSRPDAVDFSPMLLSYTIEFHYKQVIPI